MRQRAGFVVATAGPTRRGLKQRLLEGSREGKRSCMDRVAVSMSFSQLGGTVAPDSYVLWTGELITSLSFG